MPKSMLLPEFAEVFRALRRNFFPLGFVFLAGSLLQSLFLFVFLFFLRPPSISSEQFGEWFLQGNLLALFQGTLDEIPAASLLLLAGCILIARLPGLFFEFSGVIKIRNIFEKRNLELSSLDISVRIAKFLAASLAGLAILLIPLFIGSAIQLATGKPLGAAFAPFLAAYTIIIFFFLQFLKQECLFRSFSFGSLAASCRKVFKNAKKVAIMDAELAVSMAFALIPAAVVQLLLESVCTTCGWAPGVFMIAYEAMVLTPILEIFMYRCWREL